MRITESQLRKVVRRLVTEARGKWKVGDRVVVAPRVDGAGKKGTVTDTFMQSVGEVSVRFDGENKDKIYAFDNLLPDSSASTAAAPASVTSPAVKLSSISGGSDPVGRAADMILSGDPMKEDAACKLLAKAFKGSPVPGQDIAEALIEYGVDEDTAYDIGDSCENKYMDVPSQAKDYMY